MISYRPWDPLPDANELKSAKRTHMLFNGVLVPLAEYKGSYLAFERHNLFVKLATGLRIIPDTSTNVCMEVEFKQHLNDDASWRHLLEDRLSDADISIAHVLHEDAATVVLVLQTGCAIDHVVFFDWLILLLSDTGIAVSYLTSQKDAPHTSYARHWAKDAGLASPLASC